MFTSSCLLLFMLGTSASALASVETFPRPGPHLGSGLSVSRSLHPLTRISWKSSSSSTIWRSPSTCWRRYESPGEDIAVVTARSVLSRGFWLRGGATASTAVQSWWNLWTSSPQSVFQGTFVLLALTTALAKILPTWLASRKTSPEATADSTSTQPPPSIQSLQRRFLAVFWLLRCADWLQGPYFYEVYATKTFGGQPASMSLVSRLFLTGFASTALFGPVVGRAADQYGRKKATLAFTLIYAAGAWSTKSPFLAVLLAGRILSGIGTSLLFCAPEAWLVGAAQQGGDDPQGTYLGRIFGAAYAGDALVAMAAGQMAGLAAQSRGPTGPFELSAAFLLVGGLLAAGLWTENVASRSLTDNFGGEDNISSKPSIADAVRVVRADPKIMLVGAVQSLFEAAMYIFVLQWPPAVSSAIQATFAGSAVATPYGTIFSCFMACCLLGSTLFGALARRAVSIERSTSVMLTAATVAMTLATWTISSVTHHPWSLAGLMASFFAFEMCVGMYFPSIGTLRSRYLPDSHRSVIMNLFGIPLNVLVVGVFISIHRLGLTGALSISSGALGLATLCILQLQQLTRRERTTARKMLQ